jgi:hypothetical protein
LDLQQKNIVVFFNIAPPAVLVDGRPSMKKSVSTESNMSADSNMSTDSSSHETDSESVMGYLHSATNISEFVGSEMLYKK